MLVRSGITLIKYWFSVSDEEQERRFQGRITHPEKNWKLSPMDLESRARWVDYSRAKDEMFRHTDTKQAPWWVVEANDKATRPAQLHPPPAVHDPVLGTRAAAPRGATTTRRHRIRASARRSADVRAGGLLNV